MTLSSSLDSLRTRAREYTSRAHVPFSNDPAAAVLLLDDGTWVPGVRLESASYSLTLSALLNAYTTVVAAGRRADVVAFVSSQVFRREECLYVDELPFGPYQAHAEDAWIHQDAGEKWPSPEDCLSPFLDLDLSIEEDGVREARSLADRAYVPSSNFPVGALLETADRRFVPGVNVEHPDWARILCAERNALGTTQSYGVTPGPRLYLSCLEDPEGTPCGACRQLLVERAPNLTLWMDRHSDPPEQATLPSLLPGSFRGRALLDST